MLKRKTKSSTMRERSGTDGVRSQERNWSELPEDILHLFSKKLLDISDFIRFRAVCKRWQLSAPVTDPPPQLPWILEYRLDPEESSILRFYCLLSGKVHTITCPGSRDALLIGPACCYILASHWTSSDWTENEGGDIVVISGIRNYTDYRNNRPNMMAFWRPKADDWVSVEGIGFSLSANAFYMGQYFCNDERTGITYVIDIATKKLAYQVAPPEGKNPLLEVEGYTIMVESGGKILRLFHHDKAEPCHFDIHYLYFGDDEGKPCWVKITDIGDQMLFLQYNGVLSFCASNFDGFKGNCIYFLKDEQYLCRYDIGDGMTEVLPCPFDLLETWFVPSLVNLSHLAMC